MQTVEHIADLLMSDDTNNASKKDAFENDVAQMEDTGDDIAHPGKRHCTIRREVGSIECEKEAADDSKSEVELVDVAYTLKRAISEKMRVVPFPVSSKQTQL